MLLCCSEVMLHQSLSRVLLREIPHQELRSPAKVSSPIYFASHTLRTCKPTESPKIEIKPPLIIVTLYSSLRRGLYRPSYRNISYRNTSYCNTSFRTILLIVTEANLNALVILCPRIEPWSSLCYLRSQITLFCNNCPKRDPFNFA
jgi:hypothetical protein